MPLPDQIAALRDRTLAEFGAVEQYLADARQVWRLANELAVAVATLPDPADTTPPLPSPVEVIVGAVRGDLPALAARGNNSLAGYFVEATFQQTLSVFEAFVADLLELWLMAYPKSLAARQLDFRAVLDAADRQEVIAGVVRAEVAGVMYKSVADWFRYLEQRVGLPVPPAGVLARLAEAKATRNVLVHNRGLVNPAYAALAGTAARQPVGERIEMPEPYRRGVWELVRGMAADISEAALQKPAGPTAPDRP